ncbi:helix-turn-helix domain-containing protein [Paenibacillus pinisoli]|uniref:Helix-turn-helix domain-containing protein n=1 Tax=Paenibacillus pinisoli TaxID=1276110 RepID=A0A3A6PI12_9BACL|nr:helix-turn-helix domain-containing protein [Paenibacillus pinisoli]RJX39356.1 helix-turn-helix domain-containing protein [Paenibacillus pinisoli]
MNPRSYFSSYPLHIATCHYREGFRSEPQQPEHGIIGIVQSGAGMLFLSNGRSCPLQEGSFFFARPGGVNFELMADPGGSLKLSLVHYWAAQLDEEGLAPGGYELLQGDHCSYRAASAQTESLLSNLRLALSESGPIGDMRKQLALYELLLHLHAHQHAPSRAGTDSIQTTIEYMERRLSKPLQVSELPRLAGMTPSSYCRAFKKLTGLSPGSYLTKLRMLKAKELMTDKQASLRDIAVSVGYQDELYFSRVFKKTEGISPSVYLKRRDRKIAVVSSLALQDHLLALGILPIAAPSFPSYHLTPSGFPSYLHERLAGTVPLNAENPIRSSDVVPLGPDLILRTKLRHDLGDTHWGEEGSAILIDHSTSWEYYFRAIAGRVDRMAEAERAIRAMSILEQEARRKLEPVSKHGKWTIIRLLPDNCRIYGVKEHALTDLFYGRLKFQADERITHGTYLEDAFDRLIELDPEQLLVVWSEEPVIHQFNADPRWQQLRAVRENRVYYPDSREWDPWGPIGREHMIKAMVRYFVKL